MFLGHSSTTNGDNNTTGKNQYYHTSRCVPHQFYHYFTIGFELDSPTYLWLVVTVLGELLMECWPISLTQAGHTQQRAERRT
jgi:hypothetical protein